MDTLVMKAGGWLFVAIVAAFLMPIATDFGFQVHLGIIAAAALIAVAVTVKTADYGAIAHPFQWGSERTGPDLARVGGRYSDQWHVEHLTNPRAVVPESIMPSYAFLAERELDPGDMRKDLTALRRTGVPYSKEEIAAANDDLRAQADPDADAHALQKRYPKAQVRDFDGDPGRVTEMDALVAYLQMLGTLVDVKSATPQERAK